MGRLGLALCAVAFGGCALYQGPDQEPACEPVQEGHEIASVDVAASATQATQDGMDLDGDGHVDNQLGSVLSSILSSIGISADDTQARIARRLGTGFGWFVQLDVCPDSTTATFFDGVPIGMMMDFADVGTWPGFATASHTRASISPGGGDAIVAGVLTGDYAHEAAVGIQPWIQQQRDLRNEVGAAFDTNNDGVVPVDEIEGTTLWLDLMAPDINLDGATADSLSFGFHVEFR